MKLLFAVLFMFSMLLPSSAGGNNSTPDQISLEASYSLSVLMPDDGAVFFQGCHVRTQGGNLNVRSRSGRIIAKLPNGTPVRLLGAGWRPTMEMIATVRGRRIRGWVAVEFLADCD
jgi:hypothetical protein